MKRILFITVLTLAAALVFAGGASDRATAATTVRLNPVGAMPIVDEPVDMTYMLAASPSIVSYEYGQNWLTTMLQDLTNVRLTLRPIPSADYAQRLNLMFASRADLPDMVADRSLSIDTAQMWGAQGVLKVLEDDFLEANNPNYLAAIAARPAYDQLVRAADGKIYGYAQLSPGGECYHCNPAAGIWINTDFLETLGLDMPTTTEEFRTVLRAFRDGDPNRTGRQDTIPLVGARTGWHSNVPEILLNSFITWQPGFGRDGYYLDRGTVKPAFVEEGYRQGLIYLNSLVQEGLFDPVSFTQDANQMDQLVQGPTQIVGAYPSGAPAHYNSDHRDSYTHLLPLRGPTGVQFAAAGGLLYEGVGNAGHGLITTAARYPEVAARWFDIFYANDDLSISTRWGQKDIHWRYLRRGEESFNSARQPMEITMLVDVWSVLEPHSIHWYLNHPLASWKQVESANWDTFDFVARMGAQTTAVIPYLAPDDMYVPPLRFFAEEIDEYNDLRATINTYVNESMARFIVGDLNIQTDWNRYVSELRAMGLNRFTEMKQKAYDRSWR